MSFHKSHPVGDDPHPLLMDCSSVRTFFGQAEKGSDFKRRQWLPGCGDFCGYSTQTWLAIFNKIQTTALILPCALGLEKSFCFCIFSLHFRSVSSVTLNQRVGHRVPFGSANLDIRRSCA